MTEQDLKKLKENSLSVERLIGADMIDDLDYQKTLQIFLKQQKLITDEETRFFNEKLQRDRYELEKDRLYASQKLDSDKFAEEKRMRAEELNLKKTEADILAKRYRLDREKQKSSLTIEQVRLEIEKMRLEMEKENSKLAIEAQRSERKFRYISLAVTSVVGLAGIIVPLVVYRKLAYDNLKLIYKDEGRPTQDFKDAIRHIKAMTK